MTTRRDTLRLILASLLLPRAAAFGAGAERAAGCRFDIAGAQYLSMVDLTAGVVEWDLELPGRGHSVVARPGSCDVVAFARRPGTFMAVADSRSGALRSIVDSVPGRHFFGHGVFSAAGRFLFATENDFEAARGVIGVYDAANDYRRVGEFGSGGVGPHQLKMRADGRTLAVANGGIHTHPDYGRSKLNLDSMRPNLALVDSSSGALLARAAPPPRLHQLSIRHVAVGDGGLVCIAMQYQGPKNERPPLVAFSDGRRLELLDAPADVQARMHNYCGSVAWISKAGLFAVSSPHAGLVTLWSADVGFVGAFEVPAESSAICTGGAGQSIWSIGGEGAFRNTVVAGGRRTRNGFALPGYFWDNHVSPMPRDLAV